MVYTVRYLHNKSYLTVRFSSVYRHESVRIQVCTYTCIHVRIHTRMHMHTHTRTYTHMHTHTRTYTHTHAHAYTYISTYPHVYTYMHTLLRCIRALPVHNNIYTQRYNYTFILAKLTRCISFRIKTLHYMII